MVTMKAELVLGR